MIKPNREGKRLTPEYLKSRISSVVYDKKEHPCMVPYEQLPVEQKAKDYILRSIIHSFK